MGGKQAAKGQKQIDRENGESLNFYRIICLVGIVISFTPPAYAHWASENEFEYGPFMAPAFGLTVDLILLKLLSMMVSSGLDINQSSGSGEDFKDIIFVTAACQILGALFSTLFWWMWVLVPGAGLYRLWVSVLAPWFFAEAPSDEVDEKKQKKLERRMKRAQQPMYR